MAAASSPRPDSSDRVRTPASPATPRKRSRPRRSPAEPGGPGVAAQPRRRPTTPRTRAPASRRRRSRRRRLRPTPESSSGDATEVTLPALGESVTEGTVTQWLKSVGDEVAVDEPLLEVSTDKVDTEIPSPVAGTLLEIKVGEDETVEVGAVLALVGSEGAASGARTTPAAASPRSRLRQAAPAESGPAQEAEKAERPKQPSRPPSRSLSPSRRAGAGCGRCSRAEGRSRPAGSHPAGRPSSDSDSRSYVTPLVRKLATQHDVDLSSLTGTGVGGRIRKQDVLGPPPRPRRPPRQPRRRGSCRGCRHRRRRSVARGERPARQDREAQPAAQGDRGADGRVAAGLRPADHGGRGRRHRRSRGCATRSRRSSSSARASSCRSCRSSRRRPIDALKTYPQVNASIDTDAGTVTYHDGEHLGIAVDTERGLLVPVIKNAGDLSIAGLARKIADLAARTRDNKVSPDELSGGTFTLTNTGSRGALFDTPIINQPQVAILGTGTVVKRPVVIDDAEPRRDDRGPADGLPGADVRPPAGRRRRRGPLPDRDQAAPRRGQLRGRARHLTHSPGFVRRLARFCVPTRQVLRAHSPGLGSGANSWRLGARFLATRG